MRLAVTAVARTVLFTLLVPGTVAVYVPWRLRQHAIAVSGVEEILSIGITAIGAAIYLHTAF